MSTHIVEGVGFGVHGYEENYLLFIEENGEQRMEFASRLLPEDGRVGWSKIEALMGGFGPDHNETVLEREGRDLPRAYRVKITVEYEPLTFAETQELIDKAKARNEDWHIGEENR